MAGSPGPPVAPQRPVLRLDLRTSVLSDATVVQIFLLPATMTLLGEWNWWAADAAAPACHDTLGLFHWDGPRAFGGQCGGQMRETMYNRRFEETAERALSIVGFNLPLHDKSPLMRVLRILIEIPHPHLWPFGSFWRDFSFPAIRRIRNYLSVTPLPRHCDGASLRPSFGISTVQARGQVMYRTSSAFSAQRVIILTVVTALLAFMAGVMGRAVLPAAAAPASAVDESKVPHYFGPYPNWANSQFTLPDVAVTITGDGTGATATATVGANGAVTGLTLTNPGSGYTAATVDFTGAGGQRRRVCHRHREPRRIRHQHHSGRGWLRLHRARGHHLGRRRDD